MRTSTSHKRQNTPITRAVIYARVSSRKQVDEGHGLSSQKSRCSAYAESQGYEIEASFLEEGVSGGVSERPQMQEMLAYLDTHSTKDDPIAVIIDDISRLARDVMAHAELRASIMMSGGVLESPSMDFGEDADSKLVEYLLATVSQHQRQKNAEQVRNRMKARWMAGYYTANPGIGYRYEDVEGHGKMLVPYEPEASLVKLAFKNVASGRLRTASEVKRFLEQQPDMPRTPSGTVRLQAVIDMLRRSIYAGYVTVKTAGIYLQPAQHEPLITFDEWEKAQAMLDENSNAPARQGINEDFVLRNFVNCSCCGNALTAGWSKGRNKKYPYYTCQTRTCELRGKSIRRDKLEGEFSDMVQQLRPAPQLFHLVKDLFETFWNQRLLDVEGRKEGLTRQLAGLSRKIDALVQRVVATDSPSLVSAYEEQIKKLEVKRIAIGEQVKAGIEPLKPFDEMFTAAMRFIANPCIIWENGTLDQRRLLVRLAFPNNLTYDRETGYRTAQIALPFKLLGGNDMKNLKMGEPDGIEPTTSCMPCKRSPN